MKNYIIIWIICNGIAMLAAAFSLRLSPDTLFVFPYLHLFGIISLFFLINLPFYAAYDRLKDEP
jgi:hypothetical protein